MIKTDVILEDTTLRDGEQTPGIFFTATEKMRIHDKLVESGVRWIEAGIPAMGGEELLFLKQLLARGSDARLIAWNRGIREDVAFSIDLGFKAVHIGLPTSELHLEKSVGKTKSWLLAKAKELVQFAKEKDVFVSISAEDVGRTDKSFLLEYAQLVQEAGADRLRLSDTVGILKPEQYGEIVGLITSQLSIAVQCHTHNDYGLALANLLEGIKAGAAYFHVTVNGIGERAGMTDLAQAVLVLKNFYGIDTGIDCSKLCELSALVSEIVKVDLPLWHPITGENVFAHESGIHVNGMLKDSKTFEPFDPESVGGHRKYILGKHSGRALVAHLLTEKKIPFNEEILNSCLTAVRQLAVSQKKPVSEQQLFDIYQLNLQHASV
jgi:homocitrate synthase NifV